MKALVTSLVMSDSFLYRVPPALTEDSAEAKKEGAGP
jgi:hypothetical protein